MSVLKFLWWLVGVGVAVQYFYWGAMQAGSLLSWCAPPSVDPVWLMLAFVGAGFAATERLIPSLRAAKGE